MAPRPVDDSVAGWPGRLKAAGTLKLEKGEPADANAPHARQRQDSRNAGWAGDAAAVGWVRSPERHRTGGGDWPAVQPVPGRRRGGVGHGDRGDGVVAGALPT